MAGNYGSGAGYYPPPAGGYPSVAPSPLVVAPNMYSPPPAVMVTQVTPSVGFVTSPVGIQREWAHGVRAALSPCAVRRAGDAAAPRRNCAPYTTGRVLMCACACLQVLDCCAGPTGMSDCCYVMCCPLCAAGDIAQAAGRSCTYSHPPLPLPPSHTGAGVCGVWCAPSSFTCCATRCPCRCVHVLHCTAAATLLHARHACIRSSSTWLRAAHPHTLRVRTAACFPRCVHVFV
ncbi:hypothetical protein EON66_00030 [archaeon]|nr:MAG: hypothetical protein EON66_00030 [archaeon]